MRERRRKLGPPLAALVAGALLGCAGTRSTLEPFPRPATRAPSLSWETLGASLQGRAIRARTFGDGGRRVYLIAGIHGDERGGVENAARLALLLGSETPEGVVVRYVPDVNPDGTAERTRGNARGVDLNRNWPARNYSPARSRGHAALSEPEAAAIHTDLTGFEPDLVVVLHAARSGPFVNYDGPALPWARAFADAAAAHDPRWRVRAEMGYETPGSLGSLVGVDWGVPILTIECARDDDGDAAWPALRAGVMAVLELE